MSDIIGYLSVSDLLHLAWSSLGPSMLLQMALFPSFLWLSNIPLYICTTSSLSFPLSWIGCFHVLAIVKSAAVNIGVHVSFQSMVFSGYVPRSGIAGSYGSCIFSFWRNRHTLPLRGCTHPSSCFLVIFSRTSAGVVIRVGSWGRGTGLWDFTRPSPSL